MQFPSSSRRTSTEFHPGRAALLLGIVIASLVFWNSPVWLPFKLLSVMGHETGHAVAAMLSGGSVDRVTLRANESGQCLSSIPSTFFAKVFVYSGGYVGSALIGVTLMLLTYRFRARRLMLGGASVWLLLMGLFFARDSFTLAFCLGVGALFALATKWLPDAAVGLLNLFIASFSALYALVDLKDDLWNSAVRHESDAQLLADITPLPAIVWAFGWTLLSVALLAMGTYAALRDHSPRRATPSGGLGPSEIRSTP